MDSPHLSASSRPSAAGGWPSGRRRDLRLRAGRRPGHRHRGPVHGAGCLRVASCGNGTAASPTVPRPRPGARSENPHPDGGGPDQAKPDQERSLRITVCVPIRATQLCVESTSCRAEAGDLIVTAFTTPWCSWTTQGGGCFARGAIRWHTRFHPPGERELHLVLDEGRSRLRTFEFGWRTNLGCAPAPRRPRSSRRSSALAAEITRGEEPVSVRSGAAKPSHLVRCCDDKVFTAPASKTGAPDYEGTLRGENSSPPPERRHD
jgi:hypothetical protein